MFRIVPKMNANGSDKKVYEFDEFRLFPHERLLLKAGGRVALTPRVLDLLIVLVENHGELVNKETLLEKIWADSFVEEGNINRTVSTLRKSLGVQTNGSNYIETVPKIGYRFIAPVEEIYEEKLPNKTIKKSSKKKYILAFGVIILLIFAAGFAYFWKRETPPLPPEKKDESGLIRLTNNQTDEDAAYWTNDNQIRFVRFVTNTKAESFVINADGSGEQRSNGQIKNLRTGSWSPDGKKVIFNKEGEKPFESYLADVNGANEVKLPFRPGPLDWSPDSTQFVYSSNSIDPNNNEIFIYNLETGKSTNISNSASFDANPSFSPDGKQVVFNSSRDGNTLSIYLMNTDGSNIRRLTNHPTGEVFPVFSPDGTQILFNSKRENEKVGIYLINVNDNAAPVKISDTSYNAETRQCPFSPDGTRIVFTSDKDGDKFNIYVMNVEPFKPKLILFFDNLNIQSPTFSPDGKKIVYQSKLENKSSELCLFDSETQATRTLLKTENSDLSPAWSPDGNLIAFNCKIGGNTEICTVKPDGGDLQNLTNNAARDASSSWSPDGKEIIFSSDRDGNFERLHLFRMNSNGTNQRRITQKDGYELTPAWSPDGASIAFAGDRADGKSNVLDIFLLDLNNPNDEKILAVRRFHDTFPAFSPDGKRIAFVSQSDGNSEIYLMNTDGTGLLRLTRNANEDTTPQFSKDGKKIIFSSNRNGKFALYEITPSE